MRSPSPSNPNVALDLVTQIKANCQFLAEAPEAIRVITLKDPEKYFYQAQVVRCHGVVQKTLLESLFFETPEEAVQSLYRISCEASCIVSCGGDRESSHGAQSTNSQHSSANSDQSQRLDWSTNSSPDTLVDGQESRSSVQPANSPHSFADSDVLQFEDPSLGPRPYTPLNRQEPELRVQSPNSHHSAAGSNLPRRRDRRPYPRPYTRFQPYRLNGSR
ncbi:hypothetical protein GGS21DRAFT_500075 [Xylaria nigripes]|nr:hypothetical protein GGS21DRAFT_500075 [Xylaria nigripes]